MEDRYYLSYILFYGLGVLTLLPSNFFTTATDYWMYKFRDPSAEDYNNDNRTGLQARFTSNFSIVSSVGTMGFFLITIVLLIRRLTIVQRIVGSLSGAIFIFVLTAIFVEINTDSWQTPFFVITLVTGFALTAFCSIFMASLFELVSKFPLEYLPAILSGQSICGIVAALLQIFSLGIAASSQTNGLVYFLIGMSLAIMGLFSFLMMLRHCKYFIYHFHKEIEVKKPINLTKDNLLTVLNKIKYYMVSMAIALASSIMVHPGVTSLVVSVGEGNGNKWNDVFYVPVATFLCYNFSDYIGRECAVKLKKPSSGIIITIVSVLRVGFVPMLMLCNVQPRQHLPVVFDEDYLYVIFIMIFAFTHGYLINLCVGLVPSATTEEEKNLALVLIVVFMFVMSGVGSLLSAVLVNAL